MPHIDDILASIHTFINAIRHAVKEQPLEKLDGIISAQRTILRDKFAAWGLEDKIDWTER